jgi:hypothetical protein
MQGEFAYAVFPDSTAKLYDDKDVVTGKLIKLGLLRPTRVIATGGGYKLCAYEVVTLSKKKPHKKDLSAATQPKSRRHRTPSTTRPATNMTTQPAIPPRRRRPRPATNRTTTAPATTKPVKGPLGWLGSGGLVEGFS